VNIVENNYVSGDIFAIFDVVVKNSTQKWVDCWHLKWIELLHKMFPSHATTIL
jgi:hypothetical protein